MQIKFYKNASPPQDQGLREGLQVALPGYTTTSSWSGEKTYPAGGNPVPKGRVITPSPAATMGLHQLTLEAFWLD